MYVSPYTSYYNNYNSYMSGIYNLGKKSESGTNGLFGNAFSQYGLDGTRFDSIISYQKDRLDFASNLAKSASSLRGSLSALSSALAKPLMKSAFSSDNEVMTATSSLMASAIKRDPINVEVTKLATAQMTKSNQLESKDLFGEGTLGFSIESGGKSKSFSLNVGAADTNKTVLGNMAGAINGANLGVTASVVNDNGKSSLQIVSKEAGTAASSAFSLGSLTLSGNDKTSEIGLTEANTTKAQEAKYIVDGKEATAESNNVSLGYGINATFKSEGKAEIGYKTNTDAITGAVTSFVNAYNTLNDLLGNKQSQFNGAARLNKELDSLMSNSQRMLNYVGIYVGSTGSLSVSSSKLEEAAGDGSVKSLFNGYSSIGAQLSQKAGKMISNPTSYAVQASQFKTYSSAGTYSSLFGLLGLSSDSIFNAYL